MTSHPKYIAGPGLPEDVKLETTAFGYQWLNMGKDLMSCLSSQMTARLALDAQWVVELPAPPTFDEMLLTYRQSFRKTMLLKGVTDDELASFDAGIAEARKRVES